MCVQWKSRGHFCNYCRKIIWNKIKDTDFQTININSAIWYAWDHPEVREEFVEEVCSLDHTVSNKQFNKQLKALARKYM